jgi:hypothetical protein
VCANLIYVKTAADDAKWAYYITWDSNKVLSNK